MNRFRRLAFAAWLALALIVGQQAVALHDLGHATERLASQKDSAPSPNSCGKCFMCAGLSSGAAATMPVLHVPAAATTSPALPDHQSAPTPARFAFLSRAPPTLL
jgi:hypothetical protein